MNKTVIIYNYFNKIIVKIILNSIRVYQKIISPDKGVLKVFFPQGYCKFFPHCSQYTYLAVEKYGPVKGLIKGANRVLRCNPFSKGGNDPLR